MMMIVAHEKKKKKKKVYSPSLFMILMSLDLLGKRLTKDSIVVSSAVKISSFSVMLSSEIKMDTHFCVPMLVFTGKTRGEFSIIWKSFGPAESH